MVIYVISEPKLEFDYEFDWNNTKILDNERFW